MSVHLKRRALTFDFGIKLFLSLRKKKMSDKNGFLLGTIAMVLATIIGISNYEFGAGLGSFLQIFRLVQFIVHVLVIILLFKAYRNASLEEKKNNK